jgi:hypothetical protein
MHRAWIAAGNVGQSSAVLTFGDVLRFSLSLQAIGLFRGYRPDGTTHSLWMNHSDKDRSANKQRPNH